MMETDRTKIHLVEYEALRKEILLRLQMQHQVILFCVMFTGAVISSLILLQQHSEIHPLLLFAALVYFIFGWHYFEQDFLISHVASYIENSLRPTINASSGSESGRGSALRWEEFRNERIFSTRIGNCFYSMLTLFRLFPTVGCGVLVLVGYIYMAFFRGARTVPVAWWEFTLLGVDVTLAIVMIIVAFAAFRSYRAIAVNCL